MQPRNLTTTNTQNNFKIIKRSGLILTSDIIEVMRGSVAAVHIKSAASRDTCKKIIENFDSNKGIMVRKDGVPGNYIGSSHFKKTAEEYFSESSTNEPHIRTLLGDVVDPMCKTRSNIGPQKRLHIAVVAE